MPLPVRVIVALGLTLLLAGCTSPSGAPRGNGSAPAPAPDTTITLPGRFVHEHAAWSMFILGEQVNFTDVDYDLSRIRNISAHLHVQEQHGGSIVHIEGNFSGGVPDVTLQGFLATLGVGFTPGTLTLDVRDHHNGSTWNDTGSAHWRVLTGSVSFGNETWSDAREGPLLPLRDGMRVLLTYGATPEQLAAQEHAVPFPPAPQQPKPQPA